MTNDEARKWLLTHGYAQWDDGTWNVGGYKVDAEELLMKFAESTAIEDGTRISRGRLGDD